jgi:phosphate transport system permease protein
MTEATFTGARRVDFETIERGLRTRRLKGSVLKGAGLAAIVIALGMLLFLLATIVSQGWSGFFRTEMQLEVHYDPELIAPAGTTDEEVLDQGNYAAILRVALEKAIGGLPPDAEVRELNQLISIAAHYEIEDNVIADPRLIGETQEVQVAMNSVIDQAVKGNISFDVPEEDRQISDQQLEWFRSLEERGRVHLNFDPGFFLRADSRSPELAGVWTGIVGSAMMLVIVLAFSFPIGVAAAVYLEEFAPQNRWTELVEININNLAAVPSIIYGLLGLAIFLNVFGFPRSSPLAGGAVLTLMTLPFIIISARSALRSVPPSLRDGAIMLGASRQQAVRREVLPLAMPGILTGTILGLSQALGETAPLLLMGMVAYVGAPPDSFTDSATALPVQVYLWANQPERGFTEKTQAAIMVLLGFLLVMNATAIVLRERLQRRS